MICINEARLLLLLGCLLVIVSLSLRRTLASSSQQKPLKITRLARHGLESIGLDSNAKLGHRWKGTQVFRADILSRAFLAFRSSLTFAENPRPCFSPWMKDTELSSVNTSYVHRAYRLKGRQGLIWFPSTISKAFRSSPRRKHRRNRHPTIRVCLGHRISRLTAALDDIPCPTVLSEPWHLKLQQWPPNPFR